MISVSLINFSLFKSRTSVAPYGKSLNPDILTIFHVVGKTLAYTSIRFTDKNDNLVARGSHTKYVLCPRYIPSPKDYADAELFPTYVAQARKDENNIVDELSPKP